MASRSLNIVIDGDCMDLVNQSLVVPLKNDIGQRLSIP